MAPPTVHTASDPEFDELYVISDLHMGGKPGFQLFNQGSLLSRWIDSLTAAPAAKRVALVINGDMVDFLAEPDATYFDPRGAVNKLNRIAGDPAFKPVFDSLAKFTGVKNRQLVVTLGNHDLELTLPNVQRQFLSLLTGGDVRNRPRVTLALDRNGYRCRVAGELIFCIHGNEVDTWNVADYPRIQQISAALQAGGEVEPWIPNAGTQLVIDVMNDVKKEYPFVDVLKPEAEGVVPVLLALKPDLYKKLAKIALVTARLAKDSVRRRFGFLANDGGRRKRKKISRSRRADRAIRRLLERRLGADGATVDRPQVDQLLKTAHACALQPVSTHGADDAVDAAMLGLPGAVRNWVMGRSKSEVLREALSSLAEYEGFSTSFEDETFGGIDKRVPPEVGFVVTGHTHQARSLNRYNGKGHYYNSGTWVRLMRLEKDVLNDAAKFETVFNLLGSGSLTPLETAAPPYVKPRPSVVWFKIRDNQTVKHGLDEILDVNGTSWKSTQFV